VTPIFDLYRRRWDAELDLRALKQTLQMDILRGLSPAMVRKEIWGHLLVYNVIRTLMAEAAVQAGVRPEEVSFAGALQSVNAFLPHLRMARTEEEWWRCGRRWWRPSASTECASGRTVTNRAQSSDGRRTIRGSRNHVAMHADDYDKAQNGWGKSVNPYVSAIRPARPGSSHRAGALVDS
jgi:hypothetical protein